MFSFIGSLVVMRDREAGALTGTFMHASQFKYRQFRCQTDLCAVQKRFAHVSVARTFVARASPVNATGLLILNVSMCSVVCRRHEDPTNGPTGDPGMVRLP